MNNVVPRFLAPAKQGRNESIKGEPDTYRQYLAIVYYQINKNSPV